MYSDATTLATKTCAKCRQDKDRSAFPPDRSRTDGLFPYCRRCRLKDPEATERKAELRAQGQRYCPGCKNWKVPDEFYANPGRPDGLHHHCKDCSRAQAKLYAERHPDIIKANTQRRLDRVRSKPRRPCAECGKPLPFNHAVVCSKPCERLRRSRTYKSSQAVRKTRDDGATIPAKTTSILCKYCGSGFTIGAGSRKRQYCSKTCNKNDYRKSHIASRCTLTVVEVNCLLCNSPYTRCGRHKDSKKYCSTACSKAARQAKPKQFMVCIHCGKEFVKRKSKKTCSNECKYRAARKWSSRAECRASVGQSRRARKLALPSELFERQEIYERDNWRCQLCGLPTSTKTYVRKDPFSPTLDHIIPLRLGGHHIRTNVQLAHAVCNSRKGARGHGQPRLL